MENKEENKQQIPEGLGGMLKNNLSPERLAQLESDIAKIEKPKEEERKPELKQPPITETKPDVEEEEVEETKDEELNGEEDEILKNSLFFSNPPVKEGDDIEITNLKDLAEYIKTENILDIKDETELPKLIDEFKTMKVKVDEFGKEQKRLTQYDTLFQELPDVIYQAIDKYVRGEDYVAVLRNAVSTKVDYSKTFEQHNIKDIIEHYYPGEISEDDYEDEDNKTLKLVAKEAKAKFEADRKNFKPYREISNEQYEKQQKLISDSAIKSCNKLQQEVKVDTNRQKEINKIMQSGIEGVYELMFDNNGAWKPEAAERILWLLYGKQEVNAAKLFAKRRAESRATEEFVARGKDKPTAKSSSAVATQKDLEEIALKEAKRLTGKI